MWLEDQGEEGDGSYLVLNGQWAVFGGRGVWCPSLALPRDRTRWCRGGVDSKCRRAVGNATMRAAGGGLGHREGLSGQNSHPVEGERVWHGRVTSLSSGTGIASVNL